MQTFIKQAQQQNSRVMTRSGPEGDMTLLYSPILVGLVRLVNWKHLLLSSP